jgi:prepilin-type N-terminal cleavage/methylation domain-containing protein
MRALGTPSRREAGFTLLEIIVAVAIFAFIAAVAMATMADSGYLTAAGRRARQLRMLAEAKFAEVLVFEGHYDYGDTASGDFHDEKSLGDEGADWKWDLAVRNVTVFGVATQEDAQYLFGEPTDEEKADAASAAAGTQPGQPAQKGTTQELRELTLKVTSPGEEGEADSVELIAFVPLVDRKATTTK